MKILLTALNSKFAHTNLALRYLRETISGDFDTLLKEFTVNEEFFKVLGGILKEDADIAAFSCYIWNIDYVLKLCKALKQLRPQTLIVLGGPEVSYAPSELMNGHKYIDIVLMGEGEETFPRLIKALSSCEGFENINSIAYRDNSGDVRVSGGPAVISDLSVVPSPFQGDLSELTKKAVYFESSRGCPYNCSYCLSSTTKGVRFFPIERVKDDLAKLIKAQVKQVKFVDRTFNSSKERAMEIWRFLLENMGNTTFHFEISGHLLDEEMLEFLLQVPRGSFQFEIGIQSTCEETISSVGRKTDFKTLSNALKRLREESSIHLHLDLIAGLPHETYERLGVSFDDVYSLKPHMLQLGFLKLLKGSRIRVEKEVHKYRFLDEPPYEVLKNAYISGSQLMKLREIEDVLNIYFNSGRFENTLDYLIKHYFPSPFSLFEALADFRSGNRAYDRRLGSEEAYDLMLEFYLSRELDKGHRFKEVLKLDFMLGLPGVPKRKWMNRYTAQDMKKIIRELVSRDEFVEDYIPSLAGEPLAEKLKHVKFEIFRFKPTGSYELFMFVRYIDSSGYNISEFHKIDEKYINPVGSILKEQ